MYRHHMAMRKFQWEHPYLCTMLSAFVTVFSIVVCGALGFGPILLAAFVHWTGFFSYLIAVPLIAAEIKFATDLFDF